MRTFGSRRATAAAIAVVAAGGSATAMSATQPATEPARAGGAAAAPASGFAVARDVDFTVLSALGDSAFARCDVSLDLRLDGDGGATAANVGVTGPRFPCNDMRACHGADRPVPPRGRPPLPWRGRVTGAGDRRLLELDACLDTCLGRFEGPTRFELARVGGGWALRARGAVGLSGLEIEGEWSLRRRPAHDAAEAR